MDFRQYGGTPRHSTSLKSMSAKEAQAYIDDGSEVVWDFGFSPSQETFKAAIKRTCDHVGQIKEWDGKTSISMFECAKRIKHNGPNFDYIPAQYQPEGSCVGRGASMAINVLQCALILSGFPITWRPVSHAWCYAGARTLGGDLGSRSFGAQGALAFKWCKEKGVLFQDDLGCPDTDYYKDDIAGEWGYRGVPASFLPLAVDNLLDDAVPCTSAQQCANVIASGGVVTVASDRGFTMVRDANGFCRPSGTWMHQMMIGAVIAGPTKGFGICQSWGKNVPSGPLLPGCPDNVFGAEWSVVDSMLRQSDSMAALSFKGDYNKLLSYISLS